MCVCVCVCGLVGGWGGQVPQFILDDCVERGEGAACRLVCTQPRRISAVGVAERVARERGEEVGRTVGYRIRLEARESRETRLTFCTTGVLLRRLLDDPDLHGVSHVVVDEARPRAPRPAPCPGPSAVARARGAERGPRAAADGAVRGRAAL